MASNSIDDDAVSGSRLCVNDALTDDELRSILARVESEKDKEVFGLVCKRWLRLQSTERKKLAARAGPHMLQRMADRFTRLFELDLAQSVSRSFYPGVTDSDLAVIANGFRCLRVLNLHNCKGITDVGMKAIGEGLSLLQSLDVSYCRKLTDKGLSAVAEGCCDLRILHLAGCRFVTDGILEALSKNCHNLQELGLQGCTSISDNGLINLASGCQQIKFLDINKCSNVSDVGVSSICSACSSSLKTLKLLDCYKIGDQTILSLAKFCDNLETLIIGGCRDVSDEAIKSLANACRSNLKNLRMDWCLNISDSSLSCILSLCRNLEALDIGCCEEVTDAAFQLVSSEEAGLSLKVLKVSNCPKITVAGIGILVGKCTYLEYLDVRSCPHITKAGLDEAGFHFPECCKVNFNGSIGEPGVLL
ncbi:F-box/LRR-repeat protein 4 [Gastrolobium bilobum]|uniref:F-box/LRR-repeat protein 4 n=1 Tax=Gastrolobium bilobum TaxID=150636 RepID=UPI002AB2273E|nr:F-box/LRR-repeat protein 4 [Gastrolobium bilobum]